LSKGTTKLFGYSTILREEDRKRWARKKTLTTLMELKIYEGGTHRDLLFYYEYRTATYALRTIKYTGIDGLDLDTLLHTEKGKKGFRLPK